MRPSETARIAKGNAALDRAIEEAMPLCNELGVKLAGHSTLTVAVLAAYCLRLLENGVVNHGVNPPRDGTLAFIGTIADLLQVAGSSVSRGAVMTEVKHTPTLEMHPLPWSLDAEEACILDAAGFAVVHFDEEDRSGYHALIVSAVNAYPLLNEAVEVLRGASHTLRSYQYDNASTELAKGQADHIEAVLSKLEGGK